MVGRRQANQDFGTAAKTVDDRDKRGYDGKNRSLAPVGMKGIGVFATKAAFRMSHTGRLVLIAALLALAGCADSGSADVQPFATEAHVRVARGDPGAALQLARDTRQAGDLNTAIQLYRSLATRTGATAEVVVEYGDVLLESGAADDAIDVYSHVGTGSPARLASLLGMIRAYLFLAEPAKALEYADEATALAPQDARVLVDRGVTLDTLTRHAEAQQCYRAVLSVESRHVSARNNLALSLALTGQYDEAVALITPLARSSAATPRIRQNMAMIYGLMGDSDHAATVSRMDLDEGATRANLAFLAATRRAQP